jgi:hypothetical protein
MEWYQWVLIAALVGLIGFFFWYKKSKAGG